MKFEKKVYVLKAATFSKFYIFNSKFSWPFNCKIYYKTKVFSILNVTL